MVLLSTRLRNKKIKFLVHTPITIKAFLKVVKGKGDLSQRGGSHMRPRMDFHLVLHGEYL